MSWSIGLSPTRPLVAGFRDGLSNTHVFVPGCSRWNHAREFDWLPAECARRAYQPASQKLPRTESSSPGKAELAQASAGAVGSRCGIPGATTPVERAHYCPNRRAYLQRPGLDFHLAHGSDQCAAARAGYFAVDFAVRPV